MPMPSPYQIVLSGDEQAVLMARARSARGPYRDRLRAAIVLAAAAGQDNAAIARELGVCTDMVRKWRREVLATVPGAQVAVAHAIRDLEQLRTSAAGAQFVICSRERAKLGFRWEPVAVEHLARDGDGRVVRDDLGQVVRLLCCPDCFAPCLDDEDVPLTWTDLRAKRCRCRRMAAVNLPRQYLVGT